MGLNKYQIFFFLTFFTSSFLNAQLLDGRQKFTQRDTLRGTLEKDRACYDVQHYTINLEVLIAEKSIKGFCTATIKMNENSNLLRFDLSERLKLEQVFFNNKETPIKYRVDSNLIYIFPSEEFKKGSTQEITFIYGGVPQEAQHAPWDGGFVWSKDSAKNPFIGLACEGLGASIWFPCKDHNSDEPDHGVTISLKVPENLVAVSNGKLVQQKKENGLAIYTWEVKNPINLYDISVNIANYAHFSEIYASKEKKENLSLDYYVLAYNVEKAKKQFTQVPEMLSCFEEKIGAYPFYEDGYKLVETPYLGMEHQSCIAYGNQYKNGYLGNTKFTNNHLFDYIIIHESGHEWFGNNISCSDMADMWIHEAFTTYSEAVFIECYHGKEKAIDYINNPYQKKRVGNETPIQGVYGVNNEGDGDMYHKGSLFLNTLRTFIGNDATWWHIIKTMNTKAFYHKTISYHDVLDYFNTQSGKDCTPLFEQYVKHAKIPVLNITLKKEKKKSYSAYFEWKTDVKNFNLPIHFMNTKNNVEAWLETTDSKGKCTMKGSPEDFKVDERFSYFEPKITIEK